jgi:hypothetical protein
MVIAKDIIVREKANIAEAKLGETERSNRETLKGRKIWGSETLREAIEENRWNSHALGHVRYRLRVSCKL